MKKLLFLITSLIAAGAMCIAGCSGNKQSGENTDPNDTEIIVEEQTKENEDKIQNEDKIHRPLPRTPRLHREGVDGTPDDNIDDIPEMPRPRPKKPHRKLPHPLPELRPVQPK